MIEIIQQEIREIEKRESLRILYACESGSRAWGFPSRDSDYDVRFIYLRPQEWYLSIDDRKDTLEFPVNDMLDISGWDIRKALKLFRSSNAAVYEWLQSPVVYQQELNFRERMNKLFNDFFSFRAGMHHYHGIASNTFNNDLQGAQVKVKKYFYALRPALAFKWMATHRSVPPMELAKLRILIADQDELNKVIDQLLKNKFEGGEKDTIEPVRILNHFIQNEIREGELYTLELEKRQGNTAVLDDLFRSLLKESV